jgi:hypothetical protein
MSECYGCKRESPRMDADAGFEFGDHYESLSFTVEKGGATISFADATQLSVNGKQQIARVVGTDKVGVSIPDDAPDGTTLVVSATLFLGPCTAGE